jgi:hypothetical protein
MFWDRRQSVGSPGRRVKTGPKYPCARIDYGYKSSFSLNHKLNHYHYDRRISFTQKGGNDHPNHIRLGISLILVVTKEIPIGRE